MSAWRRAAEGWAYALPALLLLALINGLPLAHAARYAGDFRLLAADARLFDSLKTTLAFTAASVGLETVLGLAFALLLARPFRGRGLMRAAVLVPWALPSAVMAMGWRWIFASLPGTPWLAKPAGAFWACVLADVWKTSPFMAVLFMSGLAGVPAELYEAAAIDGAGPVMRFRLITLPALRPTIAVAALFRVIQAFGIFDLVWVLTGGGPGGSTRTLALYVYDTVFRYQELAYGYALTLVMAACLGALALGVLGLSRQRGAAP